MGIFEKALITGEEIKDYIPQREPIIMVDAFYGIEGKVSVSGLSIKEDNYFVEYGLLNEAGIIEHIAQSCALGVGYNYKQQQLPIPTGFIGALKNVKIIDLPQAGQKIFTTVTILHEVFDINLVSVEVQENKKTITTGEMKIFLKK